MAMTHGGSAAPHEGLKDGDAIFGRIAIQMGYVTANLLLECLDEQRRQFERNETPLRLGQILLKRDALTLEQFLEILRIQKRSVLVCGGCRATYDLLGSADEIPTKCLRCNEPLGRPRALSRQQDPGGTHLGDGRTTVGKYRLIREVARGGGGIVYEAHDPDLGRTVAVKLMKAGDDREDSLRRFRREAELMARLSHPNIIPIHELAETQDGDPSLPFIVMDFVDGKTLSDTLPRLSLRERIRTLRTVAAAVGFAHRNGVVHCDLKPGNILFSRTGQPFVTDFGLARSPEIGPAQGTYGTPLYMSPEQIEGAADLDARTDVWSLGVILYEMMTGRHPFPQSGVGELRDAVIKSAPIPFPRSVPFALRRICLKALEKERSRRYASADELAADLDRWERFPCLVKRFLMGAAVATSLLFGFSLGRSGDPRPDLGEIRAQAQAAYVRGEWLDALVACERGLTLAEDPELRRIASQSRDALKER